MTYAANTTVPVDKSRAEIERTLERYGATAFAYGWDSDRALIQFAANGRQIRFELPLPQRDDEQFRYYRRAKYGPQYTRTESAAKNLYEQACRQRWRALALCIKAKLEAVETGISTFEDEFLAHIVLPDGRTAGGWLKPQIATAYETNTMPTTLPALGAGS